MPPVPIKPGIYWIGVNDRTTDLFEGLWPITQEGVSYNTYLIDDEKKAIVDLAKALKTDEFFDQIEQIIDLAELDYVILNHMEPDHTGVARTIRRIAPEAKIVCSKRAQDMLGAFHGIADGVQVVNDGDSIDLGTHTLRFYSTPMVHWPETMMTYETTGGILFSGDAFGGFGCLEGGIFDDQVHIDYFEDEILRYYSNIVGKYSPMVQKAIQRLGALNVKIVAATHGPIWRSRPAHIIDLYDRWSRYEAEPGVVLVFGSMYGNTQVMAEAVARGLSDAGLKSVRMHNVSRSHVSYIIEDVWRYQGLVLGSPTYDANVFPPMDALLRLLSTKRIAKRAVGVFGSHGWAGGAVDALTGFVKDNRLDLVEPTVDAKFSGTPEQIEQCHELGRKMVERLAMPSE